MDMNQIPILVEAMTDQLRSRHTVDTITYLLLK